MTSPLIALSADKPLPQLAQRYAAALYELAVARNQLPMAEHDLAIFAKLVADNAVLAKFLANPLARKKAASAILEKLFEEAKFSGLARHFFHVVIMNGRARDIPAIITAFSALVAASRGEVTARVWTAHALSDAQKSELSAAIASRFAAEGVRAVKLDARVDNDLLGGLRVQLGTWMYDATLKNQLNELGRYLKNA